MFFYQNLFWKSCCTFFSHLSKSWWCCTVFSVQLLPLYVTVWQMKGFLHPHVRNNFWAKSKVLPVLITLKMFGGHFCVIFRLPTVDDRKWGQRIMWSTICQTSPAGEKTGTLLFTVLYLHSLSCISIFVPGSSADTA